MRYKNYSTFERIKSQALKLITAFISLFNKAHL
jgi:hypothetical protein